jgi:hypothetical protein
MPLVAFKSMEEFQQAARAINAVNKGGLEHAFHRRIQPVFGTEPELLVSAETTAVMGPGSPQALGKARLVDPTTMDLIDGDEVDLDTTAIGNSLLFPGKLGVDNFRTETQTLCWAVSMGDYYRALCGGTDKFIGTYEGPSVAHAVTPTFPTVNNIATVECDLWYDEALVIGQVVLVEMIAGIPFITDAHCPPTSS